MIEKIKNKLIVKLVKNTHIYTSVVFALIEKIGVKEMEIYLEEFKKN